MANNDEELDITFLITTHFCKETRNSNLGVTVDGKSMSMKQLRAWSPRGDDRTSAVTRAVGVSAINTGTISSGAEFSKSKNATCAAINLVYGGPSAYQDPDPSEKRDWY